MSCVCGDNPYSIRQLPKVLKVLKVLKDFRICRMGGRLVDSGNAVVQGIVHTGFHRVSRLFPQATPSALGVRPLGVSRLLNPFDPSGSSV
jgi:hypothetical protein